MRFDCNDERRGAGERMGSRGSRSRRPHEAPPCLVTVSDGARVGTTRLWQNPDAYFVVDVFTGACNRQPRGRQTRRVGTAAAVALDGPLWPALGLPRVKTT
jgi:hypothetical protein